MKSEGRPGATATRQGRKVIAIILLSLVGAYLFLILSNKLTSKDSQASEAQSSSVSSASPLPEGMTTTVGPDGTVGTARAPIVVPAVPDAFNPGENAVGDVPSATSTYASDDPSAPTSMTGSAVPTDDGDWKAAQKVAVDAAQGYCQWSHEQTSQQYVDGIPGLSEAYRKNLSAAVQSSWPQVERLQATAKCLDAVDGAVSAESYDKGKHVAVLNVRKNQTVTVKGHDPLRRVGSFEVTVVQRDGQWKVDHIRS